MRLPSLKKRIAFQKKILSWYAQHKRDLPWRKTTNPYKIIISESMLQQTQVDRVIDYYQRWLEQLPNFSALAKVDTQKLLQFWSGLGYNNRALRLRELARQIVNKHQGKLPQDYEELMKLPGVGDYTANAILAFVYNKQVPVMDTNIRRVLIHEFGLSEDITLEELKELALACVPRGKSCIWHNALMDYGALFKTARSTGIKPLSRQGKFEGSDRQVRGHIIKQLTVKLNLSIKEVQQTFPNKNVKDIIDKMIHQGLVRIRGKRIMLD